MAVQSLKLTHMVCRCFQLKQSVINRKISYSTYSQRIFQKRNQTLKEGNTCDVRESLLNINKPNFDWDYLCNKNNLQQIEDNIQSRKGVGDIVKLQGVWEEYQRETNEIKKSEMKVLLDQLAAEIPNRSSPETPIGDECEARLLTTCGKKKEFSFKPKSVTDLGNNLGILRTKNVNLTTGTSTSCFLGDLAQLEQVLVQYTLESLSAKGFCIVSVPDIIHPAIIEGCGFKTTGNKTQVYKLDQKNLCLAGTAEIPLAGYFVNDVLEVDDLPKKMCAVSRCYRAETSMVEGEKGIYRVHQFTKVEMFGVTRGFLEESENLMEEFMEIQKELFTDLGIHFRVLEMPTQELGAPAYRKVDMEAWMPCQQFWGEISSTSNCTDFQSRRLSISHTVDDSLHYAHTVNGTACAVPRLIMNILESNQTKNGDVMIPDVLQKYMNGKKKLEKMEKRTKYVQANKIARMITE